MTSRAVALDADAFLALRSLRLLSAVVGGLAQHTRVVITGYVAHRELAAVQDEVAALITAHGLHIEDVARGTPAAQTYRAFKSAMAKRDHDMRRVDLGEAETVAWALHVEPRPVFVSCDVGARAFAARHKIPTTDVLGIGVAAVRFGIMTREALADLVSVWDSPAQFVCKPARYTTFDAFFADRWRDEAMLFVP